MAKMCLSGCGRDGRHATIPSYCEPCRKEADRAKVRRWKARHPEQQRGIARRSNLLWKYGLTLADYDALLAEQGGVCAVCRTHETKLPLHVDHCHSTGRVRGLLCSNCNTALGKLKESPDRIAALLRYAQEVCA